MLVKQWYFGYTGTVAIDNNRSFMTSDRSPKTYKQKVQRKVSEVMSRQEEMSQKTVG